MAQKRGLGKGLDALFIDNDTQAAGSLMRLRLSQIEPNKAQPRERFDPESLQELADSIAEHGVLQPIIVRTLPGGSYQIIAGERRWRASRLAKQTDIPAIVIEADDTKTAELALIENLQRENLSPIEEAQGYKALMEAYGLTQEQVAQRVGKSRSAVANSLRLLGLPPKALEKLYAGEISPGHARVLAGIGDAALLDELLARLSGSGLTVRQLEALAKEAKAPAAPKKARPEQPATAWGNSRYKETELSLSEALGTKVQIRRASSGGVLELTFYSDDQLLDFARRLSRD